MDEQNRGNINMLAFTMYDFMCMCYMNELNILRTNGLNQRK